MNRREFMDQLKKHLRKLPFDEIKEAVDYYEQYFDDAGEENEQAAIAELGSPSGVASQIIADFAVKGADTKKSAKQGWSTVWMVILAIFASPIALPFALIIVILALTLVIIMVSVILSIGAVGLALLLSGIMGAVLSIPVFMQSFATAIFYLGAGLASFGIGAAIIAATVALSKICFGWLAKRMGSFILRRSKR